MQETNFQRRYTPSFGIGARLKSAREALKISEKDAAAHLRLHVKLIELMENEDFDKGPPPIFLRGYLRQYARMLNFSDKEIDQAIEELGMNAVTSSAPSTIMYTPASTNTMDQYVRWVSYIVILVIVALVIFWWVSHKPDSIDDIASKAGQTQSVPLTPTGPAGSTPIAPATLTNQSAPNSPQPANTISNNVNPPANPPAPIQPPTPNDNSVIINNLPPAEAASPESTPDAVKPNKEDDLSNMQMAVPEPGLY